MLCYREYRTAIDILHDTFNWIVTNRGTFKLVCAILIVSVGCFFLIVPHTPIKFSQSKWFDDFFALLNPFDFGANYPRHELAVFYGTFAAFTTLLMAPYIQGYFIDKRSIVRYNPTYFGSAIKRHLASALIASAIMGVGFYLFVTLSFIMMIVVMIALSLIVPCVVMNQWRGLRIDMKKLKLILFTFILMSLIFCILRSVPLFSLALIAIIAELLDSIVPGLITETANTEGVMNFIWITFMGFSFCIAVAVSLVAMVILHGSIFPEHDNNTEEAYA